MRNLSVGMLLALLCLGFTAQKTLAYEIPQNSKISFPNHDVDAGVSKVAEQKYCGNVGGVQGVAFVQLQPMPGRGGSVMSGRLQTPTARYWFEAWMTGSSGNNGKMGTVGEEFMITIDLVQNGFVLTSNPFSTPTRYLFTRC